MAEGSAALLRRLPPATRVFLPHLPGSQFDEVVAAALAVQRAGLRPVAHVAARRWRHAAEAERALQALYHAVGHEDGLELLVVGGTERSPRGTENGVGLDSGVPAFENALGLVSSGLLSAAGVRTVCVAAHPEGIPGVPPSVTTQALRDKAAALQVQGIESQAVTQFSFDASALRQLVDSLPAMGIGRASLGLVGPVKASVLAKYAQACGVRLLPAGENGAEEFAYSPEALLRELSAGRDEDDGVELSLHVFPFGGLKTTLGWLESSFLNKS
eukprot:CAMPEP_0180065702 /NCGR_PEP_ID=MMETSP0985-20121206/8897_1 /TAXON_ID=483367 /ORGANISM="non described non described, Strain CCMP 2436" /LENGTH=271 /DNA_ID=CAMNT_0021996171 /DNA_START=100 /DNA_END=915 /DNA_ORIENTATION=+